MIIPSAIVLWTAGVRRFYRPNAGMLLKYECQSILDRQNELRSCRGKRSRQKYGSNQPDLSFEAEISKRTVNRSLLSKENINDDVPMREVLLKRKASRSGRMVCRGPLTLSRPSRWCPIEGPRRFGRRASCCPPQVRDKRRSAKVQTSAPVGMIRA